jgi:hypothetical protein
MDMRVRDAMRQRAMRCVPCPTCDDTSYRQCGSTCRIVLPYYCTHVLLVQYLVCVWHGVWTR